MIARVQGYDLQVINTSRDAGVKRKGTGRAKAGSSTDMPAQSSGQILLPAKRPSDKDLALLSQDESVSLGRRSASSPPPFAELTATRTRIQGSPAPLPFTMETKDELQSAEGRDRSENLLAPLRRAEE